MAIYHLNASVGRRSTGQSAAAKHSYIERTSTYKNCSDTVRISCSGNMPGWVENSAEYWRAADQHERANGVLFRQIEFALPRELSADDQNRLAVEFAEHVTNHESGNLPYSLAIHEGNGVNPHAHLMISERHNDGHERDAQLWFKRAANKNAVAGSGGARKADISSKRKSWLADVRRDWSEFANRALERIDSDQRIDHRSYDEQNVGRVPGMHIGAVAMKIQARTGDSTRFARAMSRQDQGADMRRDWIKARRRRRAIEAELERKLEDARKAAAAERAKYAKEIEFLRENYSMSEDQIDEILRDESALDALREQMREHELDVQTEEESLDELASFLQSVDEVNRRSRRDERDGPGPGM